MDKKKILLINKPHPILRKKLKKAGFIIEQDYTSNVDEIIKKIMQYYGIILRSRISIDSKFIKKAKNLKFIAREGVGLEHIDTKQASKSGIIVFNSPEGSKDTVAEHSMALILNLLNKISIATHQVKSNKWLREPNRATELKGKTVGIIGYGNMGKALAQRLVGFGVQTLVFDKHLEHYGDKYAKQASLKTLQKESDIISIHIPYEKENHFHINKSYLSKFKKPIYLINTSRGRILKTKDLVHMLKQKKVLGAALDVLEYERSSFAEMPFEKISHDFHFLVQSDNVILTPHIAGWSFESKKKHGLVLAKKIIKFVKQHK